MTKINLKYYKGIDKSVYKSLRTINNSFVQRCKLLKNPNFESRTNAISFFELKNTANVLIVNDAFANISKFICEEVKHVDIIEFSKPMAEIIDFKLSKNFNNYTIFVGNLLDIEITKKYDYIILPDLLESAKMFFDTNKPYDDFINYFKKFLKQNGYLFFLTPNRFGIQNWAGGINKLTEEAFDRLQNYPNNKELKSFTKMDIDKLFNNSNFEYYKLYYLTPDDKHIEEILTDESFSLSNQRRIASNNFKEKLFDVKKIAYNLMDNNIFQHFINDFLIVAGNKKPKNEIFYSKNRIETITNLVQDKNKKFAKKIPFTKETANHFDKIYNYYIEESKRLSKIKGNRIQLAKCKKDNNSLIFDFAKGERLDKILDRQTNLTILYDLRQQLYNMYQNYEIVDFSTRGMEHVFGNIKINNVPCVKYGNYDLNVQNIFCYKNSYTIIDYDEICPYPLPVDYIFFKLLLSTHLDIKQIKENFNFDIPIEILLEMSTNYIKIETTYIK
jgi:hypothetical protein